MSQGRNGPKRLFRRGFVWALAMVGALLFSLTALSQSTYEGAFAPQAPMGLAEWKSLTAQVTQRLKDGALLTLDKGSEDGVREGMTAIAAEGLVGYVAEVLERECVVRTAQDPSEMDSALCSYSPAEWGGYFQLEEGALTFLTLTEKSALKERDALYTEKSFYWPEGVLVGTLAAKLSVGPSGLPTAPFQLSVDMGAVQDVLLLDYALHE